MFGHPCPTPLHLISSLQVTCVPLQPHTRGDTEIIAVAGRFLKKIADDHLDGCNGIGRRQLNSDGVTFGGEDLALRLREARVKRILSPSNI